MASLLSLHFLCCAWWSFYTISRSCCAVFIAFHYSLYYLELRSYAASGTINTMILYSSWYGHYVQPFINSSSCCGYYHCCCAIVCWIGDLLLKNTVLIWLVYRHYCSLWSLLRWGLQPFSSPYFRQRDVLFAAQRSATVYGSARKVKSYRLRTTIACL